MKYHLLLAAAVAALAVPATTATAQSWSDIVGAVVQTQINGGYNQYGAYGDPYRRVSQGQAIRIAQSQGVSVRSATWRGNGYDVVGRDGNGARVTLRVDARTGQIVRFDRQWDRRRDDGWDRGDGRRHRDWRQHRRDHDDDDDDHDDDDD